MNSAINRSSFFQAVCFVIAAFVLTGCPALESISKGLSDFQREVDALRASPQASISDFSPRGIAVYLSAWPNVNTGAEFLQWLPPQFKEDWVLMTRSESLQTGTATSPRLILRNGNNFKQVFALTLKTDASFPLAHPDVIEYMQFDDATQKFRFHEIDLKKSSPLLRMSEDNANCLHCHGGSRENLRPNWDAYDSWGGMLPFNRDRIYQNSVEELAMRTILNPAARPDLAPIISQLTLPQGITRAGDGSISINYNSADPSSSTRNDYNFDGGPASAPLPVPPAGTAVFHGGPFRTIDQATGSSTPDVDGDADQGRGVELFDELTTLNAQRVAQELVTRPTTSIDVRPVALAIANGCVTAANINSFMIDSGGTDRRPFFETSHGMMNFSSLLIDTESRRRSLPRRKADIQKMNLDGSDGRSSGLIGTYAVGISADLNRVRQEVFRRSLAFPADSITRLMNDREVYNPSNEQIALFRFFLEPLDIAVDKWSMSVRGRSRTYTFADGGPFSKYINAIKGLGGSNCQQLIAESKTQFSRLPAANTLSASYADVQKIFNRSCTECHSQFGYPPAYPPGSLVDLTDGSGHANAQSRAANGTLMQRIAINAATGMSSMPLGGPPLSQRDIATIQRWVSAGAP